MQGLRQYIVWLDMRGGITAVSIAPCARVVYCVARHKGGYSSIIDLFLSNDNGEVYMI